MAAPPTMAMAAAQIPLTRDLVLAGGGHAHALLLRRWGMRPLPGVRVSLVDPNPTAPYSGMLPGHIAGHYAQAEMEIDLVRLARFAGARLILGAATGLDRDARLLHVEGRPPLAYDVLSLDVGATSAMAEIPGFAEHALPAKPLGPLAARWRGFVAAAGRQTRPPRLAVIGAGVAGVELALAMDHRLRREGLAPAVTLIEARRALPGLSDRSRGILLARLADAGIALIEEARIARIDAGAVHLDTGRRIDAALVVGTGGAQPHSWLAATGLHLTDGFVTVGDHLRSVTDAAVFAVGDCAHLAHAPRPKAGVFAVRQAPVLDHNLRAALAGGARRIFRPQGDYLKLVSLGGREALAQRGGLCLAGGPLWRLKDRIDRRFMARFHDLPAMAPPRLPGAVAHGVRAELGDGRPLCGGCGAKVAAAPLQAALAALPPPERADILSRPGDDAAVIACGDTRQVATTDHLRALTPDPWLFGRIAALHALGDVWAMGAAPQAALASVVLPRMSAELQARSLAEILDAASAVFRDAGAELAGGHSSLGAEMSLGFTVTGLAEVPVLQSGAEPGDVLLLTGRIGAGVLLAAEMAGLARGRDIAALWATLARPHGTAARILAPAAHAMTDVTGFGLAGHLLAMARASGLAAALDPAAVAQHPGARDLAEAGTASTLFAANRDSAWPAMSGFAPGPDTDLLFDPQTCGGLLAAVAEQSAPPLLQALAAEGIEAAAIGRMEAGEPGLRRA